MRRAEPLHGHSPEGRAGPEVLGLWPTSEGSHSSLGPQDNPRASIHQEDSRPICLMLLHDLGACQLVLVVKNPPARDVREMSSIPGSERAPRVGNGNLFQYSCLGNPTDRRAWWATVQGAAESDTAERLSPHTHSP